jgi:hypothetical protein
MKTVRKTTNFSGKARLHTAEKVDEMKSSELDGRTNLSGRARLHTAEKVDEMKSSEHDGRTNFSGRARLQPCRKIIKHDAALAAEVRLFLNPSTGFASGTSPGFVPGRSLFSAAADRRAHGCRPHESREPAQDACGPLPGTSPRRRDGRRSGPPAQSATPRCRELRRSPS